jgi:regulator of replication initiation timing
VSTGIWTGILLLAYPRSIRGGSASFSISGLTASPKNATTGAVMNPKRWFAWVCLALMLVAEMFLFRANHDRDAARSDLQTAQQHLREAQMQLDELKSSNTGQQAEEIASLRKQNEALNVKIAALQKNLDHLQAESQQTAQHLNTARDAIALQQDHLQQLQAQQQQAVALANANICINNLRMIQAAKQQWALENSMTLTNVPTAQDLTPYFKDGILPVCPDGGTYSMNAVGEAPTCSTPGHVLPSQ